jgi:formylglycine-generating enzyme required for sulfatase activity
MAAIPAGCFMMGCVPGDTGCKNNEKPRHKVCLNAFFMDVYEARLGDYEKCVAAGRCRRSQYSGYGEDRPVTGVSWDDAKAYCGWTGKRLPTEAEWEYAARGGLDGKKFPWGDEEPGNELRSGNGANFNQGTDFKNGAVLTQAGSFAPNGFGLYDMAGNVWEWVADWYGQDYYSQSSKNNPQGPANGQIRVLRGGSWYSSPIYLRASNRGRFEPVSRFSVGFRCSRD